MARVDGRMLQHDAIVGTSFVLKSHYVQLCCPCIGMKLVVGIGGGEKGGDETWARHVTLEPKQQSMESRHTQSRKKQKFKTTMSAQKVMC
ncbi:hypothetical protein J6590_071233 [Homalodisca vitripennis]|nr:hypothetical protein J6590_071233 [Homalodisca vitripennis]